MSFVFEYDKNKYYKTVPYLFEFSNRIDNKNFLYKTDYLSQRIEHM